MTISHDRFIYFGYHILFILNINFRPIYFRCAHDIHGLYRTLGVRTLWTSMLFLPENLYFVFECIYYSWRIVEARARRRIQHTATLQVHAVNSNSLRIIGRVQALGIQYCLAFSYVLVEVRQQEFLQRNIATSVATGIG